VEVEVKAVVDQKNQLFKNGETSTEFELPMGFSERLLSVRRVT